MQDHEPILLVLAIVLALSSAVMLRRGLNDLGQMERGKARGEIFILFALAEAILAIAMALRVLEPNSMPHTRLLATLGAGVFVAMLALILVRFCVSQHRGRHHQADALGQGQNSRAV